MRKNRLPDKFIPAKQTVKQTNQPKTKLYERRPPKRSAFHRIGGRNQ